MSFDEDIRVDGTSIMSSKYWVSDRSGLDQTPGFRSTNWDVAYLTGTLWRAKQIPETTRSIAITINAVDDDGVVPTNKLLRKAQLNTNMREVLALFARENVQNVIERDVLTLDGMGGTEVQTLTGYCQSANPIVPLRSEDFDDFLVMGVDLLFSDPVWYGEAMSEVVTGSDVITNPGMIDATNMTLTFTGGADYRLTNNSTDPITWVEIDRSGDIVLDVRQGTAYKNGTTNVIGYLSHDGSRPWMRLIPGDNNLVLTGGGSVTIDYMPPVA